MQSITSTARPLPMASPGKKPATTAVAGNLLHCAVRGSGAAVVEEEDEEDVEAGVEEVVEDGAEDELAPGATVWSAFITQFPLVSQVKPNGQQFDPQVGRATLRDIVFSELSGWAVIFCNCISQTMVLMVLQSEPLGQHKTVVFAASGMQVCPVGQQKFDGRPARGQAAKFDTGHADAESRSKRLRVDRAVAEVARQTATSSDCPNPRGDLIFHHTDKNVAVPSGIAEFVE